MYGAVGEPSRAVAALLVGIVLGALGCADLPRGPEAAMQGPLSPEAVRVIDTALHALKERLARVHTDDFPEQIVFLYGSPSRIRHKLEKGSHFDIRRPAAKAILYTMYIYDLYDLAVRENSEVAAFPPQAIYSRVPPASLSLQLYFVFIDGRLYTVSSHEFF